MAYPAISSEVTYHDIEKITKKSYAAIRHDASRGRLDMESLSSIVLYVARNANMDLASQILVVMTGREADYLAITKKAKAKMESFREKANNYYKERTEGSADSGDVPKRRRVVKKKKRAVRKKRSD